MTRDEAAIVMAYTGKAIGDFSHFHGYVERILGRPVFTHEFANSRVVDEIKEKSRDDFISIKVRIGKAQKVLRFVETAANNRPAHDN